jgi:hypothetical protein
VPPIIRPAAIAWKTSTRDNCQSVTIVSLKVDPAFDCRHHSTALMPHRIPSAKNSAGRREHKCRAIDQASERFAGSVHGGLAAISYGIEIVRRMATISQFHASPPRATLMAHNGSIFHPPIVSTFCIRLRLMYSAVRFVARIAHYQALQQGFHPCQR